MKTKLAKSIVTTGLILLVMTSCEKTKLIPNASRQVLPFEGSWLALQIDHEESDAEVTSLFTGLELNITRYDAELKCPIIGTYWINNEWQQLDDRYTANFSNKGDRDEFILEILMNDNHADYPLTVQLHKEVKAFESLPANYATGTYSLYLNRNDD